MKGIDIFCASQASTAICHNMEQQQQQQQASSSSSSSSSSSTILLGRAIDRYNPIIRDSKRTPKSVLPPCNNSQPPISPKPHIKNHKKKKNPQVSLKENEAHLDKNAIFDEIKVLDGDEKKKQSTESLKNEKSWRCTKPGDFISPPGSTRYLLGDKVLFNGVSDFDTFKVVDNEKKKKQSIESLNKDEIFKTANGVVSKSWKCTKPGDFISPPSSTRYLLGDKVLLNGVSDFDNVKVDYEKKQSSEAVRNDKSWRCNKPGDFISPPGSTRYLLGDKVLYNGGSDFDPAVKFFTEENLKSKDVKKDESCEEKLDSASAPVDQVVVLRVSLHCRGCERKMRKHISRMEGVTSFDIDFAAKKVTVTGNVTPQEVLSSISKVKNAQLLPSTVASSTPSSNIVYSGLKNEYKGAGA